MDKLTSPPPCSKNKPPPRDLPLTMWVCAKDVEHSLGCSRSLAYEHLRQAAGRIDSTRQTLRVPLDVWERYSQERFLCSDSTREAGFGGAGQWRAANSAPTLPANATRKQRNKCKQSESATPLIRPAQTRGGQR